MDELSDEARRMLADFSRAERPSRLRRRRVLKGLHARDGPRRWGVRVMLVSALVVVAAALAGQLLR